MNIFYVDHDPVIAANALVKVHMVKMILESAQLLSTAHRVLDGKEIETRNRAGARRKVYTHPTLDEVIYKSTHVNHPSAIWVRESAANYMWLYSHFVALCDRYSQTTGKVHKTDMLLRAHLSKPPVAIQHLLKHTPILLAMPDQYCVPDPVASYRSYYESEKLALGSADETAHYMSVIYKKT